MAQAIFRKFSSAKDYQEINKHFEEFCEYVGVNRNDHIDFYQKIKSNYHNHEIKNFYNIMDKRIEHPVYLGNQVCQGKTMLVVGAGPCGLRMAIEAAMLGAKVVVVEMRDYFGRNNAMQIWPFIVQDLKMIGAKFFYPRFGLGSINHISIKQMQSALMKIALMLGVQVYAPVYFKSIVEPKQLKDDEVSGWRADMSTDIEELKEIEFDFIIGADGKSNTIPGFERKSYRAKEAIAITCNFVNKHSREDAQIKEFGGLFFHHKKELFNQLDNNGIDCENFVYFKNDTHYFVMTATRSSLLKKGVMKEDIKNTCNLLRPENVDQDNLKTYVKDAVSFVTEGQLRMKFAKNHKGEDDLAIFDFSTSSKGTHATLIVDNLGKRLVKCIVGDSLIEPFWPSGSGCATGWLAVFDSAWMIRNMCLGEEPLLRVLGEREGYLRNMTQASPALLKLKYIEFTIDPKTRYRFLSRPLAEREVEYLYDNGLDKSAEKPENDNDITVEGQQCGLEYTRLASKSLEVETPQMIQETVR